MTQLPHLREGLLQHPLDDQVLVYDSESGRVHLLDATTASVLKSLQLAESAEMIAAKLERDTGSDRGEELLRLALDELATAGLTESSAKPMGEPTRREILRRFAALGVAAAIPVIVSLTPNVASGASLACGAACSATAQCPGTTRPTCHCCKKGGETDGTCSTELSGQCEP